MTESYADFGLEQANALPSGNVLRERLRVLKAKHHPVKQAPRFTRTEGRYNLLDSKQVDAQLRITMDLGDGVKVISVTTPVDGFNDYQGDDPFEAMMAIERCAKNYIGGGGTREEFILAFKRNEVVLRMAYLKERACRLQAIAAQAARDAQAAYNTYLMELGDEE